MQGTKEWLATTCRSCPLTPAPPHPAGSRVQWNPEERWLQHRPTCMWFVHTLRSQLTWSQMTWHQWHQKVSCSRYIIHEWPQEQKIMTTAVVAACYLVSLRMCTITPNTKQPSEKWGAVWWKIESNVSLKRNESESEHLLSQYKFASLKQNEAQCARAESTHWGDTGLCCCTCILSTNEQVYKEICLRKHLRAPK